MGVEIPIDGKHDYFRIETRDDGFVWKRLSIELWSRGSFTVNIDLEAKDAVAFGKALQEQGELVAAHNKGMSCA